MFLFLGETTRNGKSTLLNTFGYMLSDYFVNLDISTLYQRKTFNGSLPSSDIARIKDKRFILASEPPMNFVFDQSRLKALTGGDTITGRFLNHNDIQFVPVGKLFIGSNYRPIIADESIIKSKRLRVIPFEHYFSPEEQDSELPYKLRDPHVLSAFLNILIEAYHDYLENGLNEPTSVLNAMSAYQTQENLLDAFFTSELEEGTPKDRIKIVQLYAMYSDWCASNGITVAPKQTFITFIRRRGVFLEHGTVDGKTYNNLIFGYRIRNSENNMQPAYQDDEKSYALPEHSETKNVYDQFTKVENMPMRNNDISSQAYDIAGSINYNKITTTRLGDVSIDNERKTGDFADYDSLLYGNTQPRDASGLFSTDQIFDYSQEVSYPSTNNESSIQSNDDNWQPF